MEAYEILQHLVQVPGVRRAHALQELLPDARPHRFVTKWGRPGTNLSIRFGEPRVVLGAHHDIDPMTEQGAIDNTASVSILASIALALRDEGFSDGLEICFWDLEEPGNGGLADGAEAYGRLLNEEGHVPELAIVCDVLGIGVPWLSTRSDDFSAFLLRRALRPGGMDVPGLATPPSDDSGLARAGIPSALVTSLPASGDRRLWSVMHSPADRIEVVDPLSVALCEAALRAVLAAYTDSDVDFSALRGDPEFRYDDGDTGQLGLHLA